MIQDIFIYFLAHILIFLKKLRIFCSLTGFNRKYKMKFVGRFFGYRNLKFFIKSNFDPIAQMNKVLKYYIKEKALVKFYMLYCKKEKVKILSLINNVYNNK